METEEIREKKEPKRLPVWACILLFALGLFVCMGLYGTIGFGLLSLILGDEARHPRIVGVHCDGSQYAAVRVDSGCDSALF